MSQKEFFGFSQQEAQKIIKDLKRYKYGKVLKVERKTKRENPPLLHSLTTLQREANKLYGFSANKTLNIAQKLYEQRKLISYPRTEAKHLPTSAKELVAEILKSLGREDLIKQIPKVGKRVFDDSKLTDHHAIIPLAPPSGNLTPDELKIYNLIKRRFLAVFYPPYVYEVITVITEVGKKYFFLTREKVEISLGWKELYNSKEGKSPTLPDLKEGDKVKKLKEWAEKKQTQPPPRYTEGTLLKEMEKLGLGTPATRAQIIETLKKRRYITTRGKTLIPTEKGIELIKKLRQSEVSSPEMTARWEKALENIHLKKVGEKGYKLFMEKIKKFTTRELEKLKNLTFEVSSQFKTAKRKRKSYRHRRKTK